jgi:glycosyltransferase involved in cell wall biosynthesis
MKSPVLSICIPTFNRKDRVVALVDALLSVQGNFEICVHVDGSTDGTHEALNALSDRRLHLSFAANQGRAAALVKACSAAKGRYIMIFDDDDTLYPEGLREVLVDCAAPLPKDAVGFIYHLEDQNRRQIGKSFPVERSNLLALRADHGIRGDKKEVVLADALRHASYNGQGYRRTPTSLIWSKLALTHDVLCKNVVIGRKIYLDGGMSTNIRSLKSQNARPMFSLYALHVRGFIHRRYRSPRFFMKAIAGLAYYGAQVAGGRLRAPHSTRGAR